MKLIAVLSIVAISGALSACGGGGSSASGSGSGSDANFKSDVFLAAVSAVIGASDDAAVSINVDDVSPTSPEADDVMILT